MTVANSANPNPGGVQWLRTKYWQRPPENGNLGAEPQMVNSFVYMIANVFSNFAYFKNFMQVFRQRKACLCAMTVFFLYLCLLRLFFHST